MPRFTIDPVPKPRMTQSDKWQQRPAVMRYWAFKDELQRQAVLTGFELGECFMVIFYIPIPQSWSKVKKQMMIGQPHKPTPDSDNLIKSVKDCLLPDGDSAVWFEVAAKFWALDGTIEIVNLEPYEAHYILVRKDVTKIGAI